MNKKPKKSCAIKLLNTTNMISVIASHRYGSMFCYETAHTSNSISSSLLERITDTFIQLQSWINQAQRMLDALQRSAMTVQAHKSQSKCRTQVLLL